MNALAVPAPPDNASITDFPSQTGGTAACSRNLEPGRATFPVHHGHTHDDRFDPHVADVEGTSQPTETS